MFEMLVPLSVVVFIKLKDDIDVSVLFNSVLLVSICEDIVDIAATRVVFAAGICFVGMCSFICYPNRKERERERERVRTIQLNKTSRSTRLVLVVFKSYDRVRFFPNKNRRVLELNAPRITSRISSTLSLLLLSALIQRSRFSRKKK